MEPHQLKLYSRVILIKDIGSPQTTTGRLRYFARLGEKGVVVDLLSYPCEAFVVEVIDDSGRTVAIVDATADQIAVADRDG